VLSESIISKALGLSLTAAMEPRIIDLDDPWGTGGMDDRMKQLVEDLRGAVSQALVDSLDVDQALRRVREQGWSLYLVVDRKRQGEALEAHEISAEPTRVEAAFRIDSNDLGFLRSIGIDPTRRTRRRRADS
jgi:hypothetical protein